MSDSFAHHNFTPPSSPLNRYLAVLLPRAETLEPSYRYVLRVLALHLLPMHPRFRPIGNSTFSEMQIGAQSRNRGLERCKRKPRGSLRGRYARTKVHSCSKLNLCVSRYGLWELPYHVSTTNGPVRSPASPTHHLDMALLVRAQVHVSLRSYKEWRPFLFQSTTYALGTDRTEREDSS